MEKDQEFLEYVVKSLVDNPDDVKVERSVDERGVFIKLDVNPEDMGKIIGRQGNTATAIRILLRVIGRKNNALVNLKINEPEGGSGAPQGASFETRSSSASTASADVDAAMEDLKNL